MRKRLIYKREDIGNYSLRLRAFFVCIESVGILHQFQFYGVLASKLAHIDKRIAHATE